MKNRKLPILLTLLTVILAVFLHQKKSSNSLSINIDNRTELKNVLGSSLQKCSTEPMTGFLRKGSCETNQNDLCRHIVCAEMTPAFLSYTKRLGNDLTSPNPKSNFPGLTEGDLWCLCISRWLEALNDGVPPPVLLHATPEEVLNYISIEELKKEAVYTKEF